MEGRTRGVTRLVEPVLLAAGSVLIGVGCNGGADVGPPSTGGIEITTATSGPEPDPDGYIVTIDAGTEIVIGTNATLQRDNLEPRSYSVRLSGITLNCTVEGNNPRTASVTAGETIAVGFQITCSGFTGSVEVTTATSGPSPDPDGYTVTLDGADHGTLGASGSVTLDGLTPGSHAVGLNGIAANCRVQGDNPRAIEVPAANTVTVGFSIGCSAVPAPLIAFESFGPFGSDILVVSPDGTGLTNLTRTRDAVELDPEWSPDRRKIAFNDYTDVYVMNLDGTGRAKLTNRGFGRIDRVRWSPDGSMIAFVTYCCADTDTDEFDIWIMRADGSGQRRLVSDALDPSWSPDGSKIVFVPSLGSSGIFVINADGTGRTLLVAAAGSPAWSPDGSRIAFVSAEGIQTIRPDGTGRANLTSGLEHDRLPVWSPDGSKIAFEMNPDTHAQIGVMNSDGSGRTNVTNNPAPEGSPAWSPDGSKIAFVRYDQATSKTDIYVVNVDGTAEINVSKSPNTSDDSPEWSSR